MYWSDDGLDFNVYYVYCYLDFHEYILELYRKRKAQDATRNGRSKSSNYYIDKNYQLAESEFETLGFKNIKTIDLNDDGLFNKKDMVDNISINGDDHFSEGDIFDPENDTVIISYH